MNNEKQLTNPSSFLFYSLLYVADTATAIICFSLIIDAEVNRKVSPSGFWSKKNEAVQKDSVQISSRVTQDRGLFIINQSGRQGNAHS